MSCLMKDSLSQSGNRIRLLETHNNDSTEIIRSISSSDGSSQFHGQWVSGLTQATILGVPDTELITPLTRAGLIPTNVDGSKALSTDRKLCTAFDADSGGPIEEIPSLVAKLASKGVCMAIMEDKEVAAPGSKVNSLAASSASQGQADPQEFAKVMTAFKRAKQNRNLDHMLITARIESFTCRKVIKSDPAAEKASVQDALRQALERAFIYRDAGADAIMIHSKSKEPDEVLDFLRQFRLKDERTPLVVVPTTYGSTHEDVMYDAGANVIIYANHLMRAKIRAVDEYIKSGESSIYQVCPPSLSDTLYARNFGYFLHALQKLRAASPGSRLKPDLEEFLEAAERVSHHAMEATAKKLLEDKKAGAANDQLLLVKDLLAINGVHLSEIGRPQPQEEDAGTRLVKLLNWLRSKLMRTITA